jgi:hypothetical protein
VCIAQLLLFCLPPTSASQLHAGIERVRSRHETQSPERRHRVQIEFLIGFVCLVNDGAKILNRGKLIGVLNTILDVDFHVTICIILCSWIFLKGLKFLIKIKVELKTRLSALKNQNANWLNLILCSTTNKNINPVYFTNLI